MNWTFSKFHFQNTSGIVREPERWRNKTPQSLCRSVLLEQSRYQWFFSLFQVRLDPLAGALFICFFLEGCSWKAVFLPAFGHFTHCSVPKCTHLQKLSKHPLTHLPHFSYLKYVLLKEKRHISRALQLWFMSKHLREKCFKAFIRKKKSKLEAAEYNLQHCMAKIYTSSSLVCLCSVDHWYPFVLFFSEK